MQLTYKSSIGYKYLEPLENAVIKIFKWDSNKNNDILFQIIKELSIIEKLKCKYIVKYHGLATDW